LKILLKLKQHTNAVALSICHSCTVCLLYSYMCSYPWLSLNYNTCQCECYQYNSPFRIVFLLLAAWHRRFYPIERRANFGSLRPKFRRPVLPVPSQYSAAPSRNSAVRYSSQFLTLDPSQFGTWRESAGWIRLHLILTHLRIDPDVDSPPCKWVAIMCLRSLKIT
jgi:hypothetical protein